MRTVRRLLLRFLLLRPGDPNPTAFTLPSCPLCYSLPCRNLVRPINKAVHKQYTKTQDLLCIQHRQQLDFRLILMFGYNS